MLFSRYTRVVSAVALSVLGLLATSTYAQTLPHDFIELHQVAPFIQYNIRYASRHNFVGRRLDGYHRARCLLTKPAALALANVEDELLKSGLSLMVYDCYRPQRAVNEFIKWSKDQKDHKMKQEFYPQVNKKDFFKLGYVAAKSGHSRGSTVDLTIISIFPRHEDKFRRWSKLVSCYAPYMKRFNDGSIDMGTGFDCMDPRSFPLSKKVNVVAHSNRMLLRSIMQKHGFVPYAREWWHFTLKNEPYPHSYYNVPIDKESLVMAKRKWWH